MENGLPVEDSKSITLEVTPSSASMTATRRSRATKDRSPKERLLTLSDSNGFSEEERYLVNSKRGKIN